MACCFSASFSGARVPCAGGAPWRADPHDSACWRKPVTHVGVVPLHVGVGLVWSLAGEALVLGALKSHIGHTEGAAGVIGVLKAATGLQRMQVPPNLHLSELNPKLELEGFSASMPMQMQELAMQSAHACAAGVSSFGMSGTNAHAVLEATEHHLTSHEALNGFCNKVLTAFHSSIRCC